MTVRGFIFLICSLVATEANAWGPEGHRVSGMIADQNLLPEVKRKIQEDFNINSLADVSVWADRVRDERENGRWHYCNIKESETTYDRKRDCPHGECVVEVIKRFKNILSKDDFSAAQKEEALKYLVHFVGDIHQPLHLGNKIDFGGGTIRVMYLGKTSTLHYLWDGGFINFEDQPLKPYSQKLSARISKEDKIEWSRASIDAWANESRKYALEVAYPLETSSRHGLYKNYITKSREMMELRLSQAGIRLSHLLNEGFK